MAKLNGVKVIDMVSGEITKISYDGAGYTRVDGHGLRGDIALMTDSATFQTTPGAYYLVEKSDNNRITVDDDYNEEHPWTYEPDCGDDKYFILFRKVTATTPPIEERVTKLESRVDALEVSGKTKEQPLKIGDYAKVIGGFTSHYGKIGKVSHVNDRYVSFEYVIGDKLLQASPLDTVVKATDEEVAQAKAELKPKRLTIGDYAKVVNPRELRLHLKGEIIEIAVDEKDYQPYKSDTGNWFYEDELERVSDEEVSEYKAKESERKKWASIGCEVGEFKKGDIVTKDGEIDVVKGVKEPGYVRVDEGITLENYGWSFARRVALVTPVERRFDLTGVTA